MIPVGKTQTGVGKMYEGGGKSAAVGKTQTAVGKLREIEGSRKFIVRRLLEPGWRG